MKVHLTFQERLTLLSIIPDQVTSLKETILANDLREAVKLTNHERQQAGIGQSGNGIVWDPNAELSEMEYDFDKEMVDFIRTLFRYLEMNKSVPTSKYFYDLYIKLGDHND